MRGLFYFLLLSVSSIFAGEKYKSIVPLPQAHAHNDYEHPRPLLDALDHGFCSVEADIFLVKGELLVAHNLSDTKPGQTLEKLYLQPLAERVRKNNGRVFTNAEQFTLLIDFKIDDKKTGNKSEKVLREAQETYLALGKSLKKYNSMLTRFYDDRVETNAVSVIFTGARPQNLLLREKAPRFAALDGKVADLDSNISKNFIPLISERWSNLFAWEGRGEMPENEKQKLKELVAKAHAQGRCLRFWDTPDREEMWKELSHGNVDLINTDDLAGLEKFLKQ